MGKKKNWGVNPKVEEARARKAETKAERQAREAKAAADSAWGEDPKLKAKREKAEAERQKKLEKERKLRSSDAGHWSRCPVG